MSSALFGPMPRTVFAIKGKAREFLQNYASNVPEAARTAFLNQKGIIVAVADQLLRSDEEALVIIEGAVTERLQSHLARYIPLAGIQLIQTEYRVYFDTDGKFHPVSGDLVIAQNGGRLILTLRDLEAGMPEAAFRRFRVSNNMPLQTVDYDQEMVLNISEELVSFKKGCYLGQEIVARVQHRGKPPKKLVAAVLDELEEPLRNTVTSRVIGTDGRERGFVLLSA